MSTVPVFAPDGTLGDIPQERLQDAVKAGGIPGVNFKDPQGNLGVIPANRTQDAVKAGGTIIPFQTAQPQQPGVLDTIGSDLKGMLMSGLSAGTTAQRVKNLATSGPTMPTPEENAQRKAKGLGPTYRALVPAAEAIGMNVKGTEQSADEGNVSGVVGHAIAPTLPFLAGMGISKGASAIADNLPSNVRAKAGAGLNQVSQVVGKNPVDPNPAGAAALKVQENAQAGGTMPKVIRDYLARTTAPNAPPLDFDTARKFYSNAGDLSFAEKSRLSPKAKYSLDQFRVALGNSISDAAAAGGQSEPFSEHMSNYASAMKNQARLDTAKEMGVNAIKQGLPWAAGIYGAKKIYDAK